MLERFSEKYFIAPDTCWIWTGGATGHGYGAFWVDGKTLPAHRISYEMNVGPIPDGLHIDHLCKQTMCINPHHLEPVTLAENNRRKTTTTICEHEVVITSCKPCMKIRRVKYDDTYRAKRIA